MMWYNFLILYSTISVLYGYVWADILFQTGYDNKRSHVRRQALDRIVGGRPIGIEDAPFQASLLFKSDSNNFEHLCGASIVSRRILVSAAHCFKFSTNPLLWRVRLGSRVLAQGGVVHQVRNIIVHPRHGTPTEDDNDISMIILEQPIQFNPTITPVKLPSQGLTLPVGTKGEVSGFGSKTVDGPLSRQLMSAEIPIIESHICENIYKNEQYNKMHASDMFCAGYLGTGQEDACQGDSGGPFIVNNVLIGIVSWGESCANPKYPGVYTKVSAFVDWISQNANMYDPNFRDDQTQNVYL